MKATRLLPAICALLLLPCLAFGQTSGTLTPTAATYNYSTAPWVPGPFPDGGGTATFLAGIGVTPGTLFTGSTITIDVSPTLSVINFNSPFTTALAAGTGTSIVAASTGLALNVIQSAVNTPTLFQLSNSITSPISGGGSAGLTKTGPGIVTLAATNTYTGGTHINGGELVISASAAIGDSVFGAAGTDITFDGGSLFNNITSGWTTSRNIVIGAGGATFYNNTAATINGVISGSGALDNDGFASVQMTLTAANTYVGATIGRQSTSLFTLSGNGSIASSSSYDFAGSVTLTNTGTNVTNRLSDTAAMTLRGINFVDTGNASATSSETVGAVTLASSYSSFLVTPGASAGNSLTMASLTRQNNSTAAFRGTGLGGTPGAGVANIYSTAAPTLVGGGGAAGSTTMSILPWGYGNSTSSVLFTAAGLINSSLVTYDTNGFRPLATSEYAAAFGGNATDNVRLTAATAAPSGATANALLFAPAAAATLSGGPINLTSGAFLYSPTANATGTVSAALNFGSVEGLITNTSILALSGVISGAGGVTYTTAYTPSVATASITVTGANSYTGNTTLNSGALAFSGTVAATGTNSVFGNSGTIVLNGGTNAASLLATGASTLNRDISSIGAGSNYIATSTSGFTFTLNGNINMASNLFIFGEANAAASAINFNGTISGAGELIDTGLGFFSLNGNNTYTGGTVIGTSTSSSTMVLGSDTGAGTGPIYFQASSATSTIQGSGTTARTIANNLVTGASINAFAGAAPLTFTGGVNLNGSRTLNFTNTALTAFNGTIANGAVTKTGTGAAAFNSATGNSYTGGTVLGNNVGALYVNNTSGSGTGAGAVSIGATSAATFSTLAGSFNISGAASIAGHLSPGNGAGLTAATAGTNSIGTENFGSSLALASATTSALTMELASNSSFDRITVAGAFTLNGTVNVLTIGGYVAQPGDTFDLVDWGTINVGTFTVNTSGAAANGTWDTSNFATNGTITVVVPEPSTWAMILSGTGLLGAAMRFRRRQK